MSNKALIQQQTIIVHKTNETSKEVFIMDNYNQDSISLDDYLKKNKSSKSFFENPMELLLFVLKTAKKEKLDAVNDIVLYLKDHKSGIEIEGTWYEWKKIEHIFKKAGK